MSLAQIAEGFEVETQNDPARAGIFNTELSRPETGLHIRNVVLSRFGATALTTAIETVDEAEMEYVSDTMLDEQDALSFILDKEALTSTFEGVATSEKRRLVLAAMLVTNGEKFQARDITSLFFGGDKNNSATVRGVVKALEESQFSTLLSKTLRKNANTFTFGSAWYDEEHKPTLKIELQAAIDDFHRAEVQELEKKNDVKLQQTLTSSKLPISDPFWNEKALCAQTYPDEFFPEKGGSTREAKKVCLGCEVRDDCLNNALNNDERFGIWGGLTERERRKLKKRIP